MPTRENPDSTKNHRIVVSRHGGPEVLQAVEEDIPEPRPGEVRVKVLTAGVSAFDAMLRNSSALPGTPHVPYTPGGDIVGVVDKLGEGVSTTAPGQRVAAFTRFGGYAEYVCVPAGTLVRVPPDVDAAQAVCMVVNYLTAHMVMHRNAEVHSGERVLVHGAAGGVGTALLELGKLAGLDMYGTASRHNQELVSGLGATPIDYRNEDFAERILDLTGDGVDVVLDPVGGPQHIRHSYRALRKGGRLVCFGMASTTRAGAGVIPLSLLTVFLLRLIPDGKTARMSGDLENLARDYPDWFRDTLTWLFDSLAAGRLNPVIAERIPLDEAARAHELLKRGGYAGKVVLVTGA